MAPTTKTERRRGILGGVTGKVELAAAIMAIALGAGVLGGAAAASRSLPSSAASPRASQQHLGGTVSIWAEWTSSEQTAFEAALKPFEKKTGITVNYSGKGSNMDTALEAAVQGGAPPDVALVPDPGTLRTLARQGKIRPLAPVLGSLVKNYGAAWNRLASFNRKLYGVWFKAANKNTVWYNPAEFAVAGIKSPPKTWEQLIADAAALQASGIAPFSLCTDIGWPVADFWQNLYLKTAGAANYNRLATHTMKWTNPTVTRAFRVFAQLVGKPAYLLGGTQGALASTYPECVDKVFPRAGTLPRAAMVFEGDFVVSEITLNSKKYHAGIVGKGGKACTADVRKSPCYDFVPFPAPAADAANRGAIQGAGDVGMLLNPTPQAKALIRYLASAQAGAIWAHLGGFTSPNKTVPLSAYPDPVTRADAQELVSAKSFVFSLDDLQGTWEPKLWKDMLSFVRNPSTANVKSLEKTMDAQATAAMGH